MEINEPDIGAPFDCPRHGMNRKFTFLAIGVMAFVWTGVWTARAVDATTEGSNIEVDGIIEAIKPGDPGWYRLYLKLDNGNQLTLVVYPKTKFWLDYKPLDAALAYRRLAHGQKLRIMHNTFLDADLKHEMITDIMFVEK